MKKVENLSAIYLQESTWTQSEQTDGTTCRLKCEKPSLNVETTCLNGVFFLNLSLNVELNSGLNCEWNAKLEITKICK